MNKKTKICLNGMVGNESSTIMRMLESVYPYIDYWVIQCNGQDDTEKIIQDFFQSKRIPGFTYQFEWHYPGFNRDHTLQTCLGSNHGCDWILRMDADERLHVDEDFDWSVFDDTRIDSFNMVAQNEDLFYYRTWFWNAKLPWFFQHDKRHETIHLPQIGEDFLRVNLPRGFRHLVSQDGNTWAAPRKFLRDALELEIDKVVGYKVLEDHYHLWYIAKSYMDCYGNPNELPFGKQHSDEYCRRGLWYFERFFEVSDALDENRNAKKLDEMCYFALLLMGQAYNFLGDIEKSLEHFNLAEQFSPERNEHLLQMCFVLERNQRYEELLQVLDKMMQPERVNPFPRYSFLIEGRAYYNTGTLLQELKENTLKKLEEHIIDMESVKFDF